VAAGIKAVLQEGREKWTDEYRCRRADGTYAEVLDRGYVVRDEGGKAVQMIGAMLDLSERKRAEHDLRESETRCRSMANSAPVMIWMSGPDKLCTYINQPWLDFTGRPLEQALGNGWAESVHPDDSRRCMHTYVTAFDARRDFEVEYRLRRHDGE